jgi:hypothetical protein
MGAVYPYGAVMVNLAIIVAVPDQAVDLIAMLPEGTYKCLLISHA